MKELTMIDLLIVTPVVLLLLLEGLFSGGELALISADTHKIKRDADNGSRASRIALHLIHKPDWFLATTLTGTNVCAISNTALVTAFLISRFGPDQGELIAIVLMVPLILLMGEMAPKSICHHYADVLAPKIAWVILGFSWLLFPMVFVVSKISRRTVHMLTDKNSSLYTPYITKAGLESMLKNEETQSDILKSEREMIQKIFNFSEYKTDRIMVPLSNVCALPATISMEEAATAVMEAGYSRIPVYQDQIFNIIGILHTFDLLEALRTQQTTGDMCIGPYVRKNVLYVPETMPAGELLIELQKRGEQMAVIIDEYGGATGIGTKEDILEEIVGEIDDEYHPPDGEPVKRVAPGKYIVQGQTKIDFIRSVLHCDIPPGDYETIGGFLLFTCGRVPQRNETVPYKQTLFVIKEADMKSIKKVLIIMPLDDIISC
jgi:CBS domain containing-hemolysin-like protein